MSLVGRVLDDHQLFDSDHLQCKAKDHVVIVDSDPPGRSGECLCNLRGQVGYVPRSKLLLLGFVKPHANGSAVDALAADSPIYEVPPGAATPRDSSTSAAARSSNNGSLWNSQSAGVPPPHQKPTPPTPPGGRRDFIAATSAASPLPQPPRDGEYVVFDEKLAATVTSTPPTSRSALRATDGPEANGQASPMSSASGGNGAERQLVVREGTGGHPSPILRHKSSLRSTAMPRRHSTASSVPESPGRRSSGNSSGSGHHPKPVLRWADSPSIIEIPSDRFHGPEGDRHGSEGDYDDLNVGVVAAGERPASPPPSVRAPRDVPGERQEPSKHSTAIRALLRSFNAETLRGAELESVKVLLERIHWYIEDCSGRMLRFIRPRWKTVESLALTVPSLYDACTLYHSMSQVFTTFVYVCLEKAGAGDCEDVSLARKLLKHLHPLEKHRQAYSNALLCLDSLQWQPAEIERLANSPVTDYLGDLVTSLREINIKERSLYTALVANLEILFPSRDRARTRDAAAAGRDSTDLEQRIERLSLEMDERGRDLQPGGTGGGGGVYSAAGSHSRMPQPKPPMVPAVLSASPPSKSVFLLHNDTTAGAFGERRGSSTNSASPVRPPHPKSDSGNSGEAAGSSPAGHNTADAFHSEHQQYPPAMPPETVLDLRVMPGRRYSYQSNDENTTQGDAHSRGSSSAGGGGVGQASPTSSILYSPASSASPRGSGDMITLFANTGHQHLQHLQSPQHNQQQHLQPPQQLSPSRTGQELRIQVAKVESHVEVVVTAIQNFLQCLEHGQPPNVFVQHSKFVVVSAQKLLATADRIGNSVSGSEEGQRILVLTHQLCEQLKAVVASTKLAAMNYPSPDALHQMLGDIEAVSALAGRLRTVIFHLARV